jgi:hypothetical protein
VRRFKGNDMRNKRIRANANHHASSSESAPFYAGIVDRSPYELAREFIEPATDERPVEDVARNTQSLLRNGFRGKRA